MKTPNENKQARAKAGYTQASLSKTMNLDVSTVSRWERGELKLSGAALVLFKILTADDPNSELDELRNEKK